MKEKSKTLAQHYFDYSDVFMVAISFNEVVTDINQKGCEFLGYTKSEIVGKNWFDNFVPQTSRENVKRVFHEMLKGPLRHVHYEHSVIAERGVERIMQWHNVLASDQKGKTVGMLSSGEDITERKQADRLKVALENRLQVTLDSMLEGCQIIDYDWRYAYVNEAAAQQGRRTKKELIGRTMMEMYPGIDNTQLFKHLKDSMDKRQPHQMENEFTFPDGSKGWFELRIEPVPEGVLILSGDITKRREIEEELKRYRQRLEEVVAQRTVEYAHSNEKLQLEIEARQKIEEGLKLRATILDKAREAIFLLNPKGDFVYMNEAASKMYGYSRDEFLNMNLRDLMQPQDVAAVESRLQVTLDKGQMDLETVHMRKDKSLMQVQVRHNLIQTAHGKFIVSVIRDKTS